MAENEKNIIDNENTSNSKDVNIEGEFSLSEAKTEPLDKTMINSQKNKSVEEKIRDDLAMQREKRNLFQKIWSAIKRFVKEVGGLIAAGLSRMIYGKGAIQDLQKMEEMMMSPVMDYKKPKEEKIKDHENPKVDEQEKQEPEKEQEKELEVKEVTKENREVNSIDEKCQKYFDTIENKQPFQNLIKSLGFEYENNPDKPGVITITLTNKEIGQSVKYDVELKDFTKNPVDFNKIFKSLSQLNDIRSYDNNHMPKMDHIINPQELRLKTAILTASMNQLFTGGKEISFDFKAYGQNLKMEITHDETNDYAKIKAPNGEEFLAFNPNGSNRFVYYPVEKIQEQLFNNQLGIEAEEAIKEMEKKEAEIAHQKTLSYKIEQAAEFSVSKNAWEEQFDKIISGESNEMVEDQNNEVVIEAPEAQHNELQYNDDDISL